MELSPRQLVDVEYLTLDELKEWALVIMGRIHDGEHGPEIAEAAQLALAHFAAPSLPTRISRGLSRFVNMAVPVEAVRSCRKAPAPSAFPVSVQRDDTHRNAVSCMPAGLRENPAEARTICAPHVPGFRSSRFWDQTDRTPADRVAKWVDGKFVPKSKRVK